uniref:Phospholipid/glycerol acyltransferase domain-containing protein n=1 Tax=Electrophorus electricus TaxID=8005 RepID=A0AAY5F5S3_ELEEL
HTIRGGHLLQSAQSSRAEPASFVDILEERRRGSDISHALRAFSPPPGCGAPPPSPSALNKMVLESQHLRYVVLEVAAESGKPQARVREEAAALLDEMSQNLQVTFIRLLGFALSKIFTRLFRRIQVNEDGLARLQQATQEHPVILMPNHRSYVDFLVLSYIMFTYDLSIPVIAAGIPLMGMSLIGEIFRRSGAFFIRRAIGSDKLYWAVLSEYVRTIVRTGFAPVEFYVEGLRSRTLKSLTPKMGMMHMVLEPFLKGEVYDLSLVPVSISYDRVLEESLLAHELLGVPKPRETTRGLLKARRVLEQDYGSMHVYFGNPVSVRELAKGRIGRGQYNLVPRDLPGRPSEESQAFASAAAHRVVRLQERGTVLSPWSLTALLVLQRPDGTRWDLLARDTLWLRGIALQLGARLDWPADLPDLEVMSSSMALHRSVVRCEEGCVWLVEEAGPEPVTQEEGVFRRASAVLMCASYRNQALHVFTRPAMVAVAMGTVPGHSQGARAHVIDPILSPIPNLGCPFALSFRPKDTAQPLGLSLIAYGRHGYRSRMPRHLVLARSSDDQDTQDKPDRSCLAGKFNRALSGWSPGAVPSVPAQGQLQAMDTSPSVSLVRVWLSEDSRLLNERLLHYPPAYQSVVSVWFSGCVFIKLTF